jgi:transcription elongation factor Elf1
MVTITCPWCEEDEVSAFAQLQESEAVFVCVDCGTTIAFVAEAPAVLELAA